MDGLLNTSEVVLTFAPSAQHGQSYLKWNLFINRLAANNRQIYIDHWRCS